MRQGRPLRFLAVVLAGWAAARIALLWLPDSHRNGDTAARPGLEVAGQPLGARTGRLSLRRPRKVDAPRCAFCTAGMIVVPPAATTGQQADHRAADRLVGATGNELSKVQPALGHAEAEPSADRLLGERRDAAMQDISARPASTSAVDLPRLAGSTWLILRPAGGDTLAFGQLGGSQGGVRVTYALDADRRLALSGRASAPLRGAGREAAAGIDWRPTSLPIHLLIEARMPLDGGRVRPAAQLIAGAVRRVALGLEADGYVQAGAVHGRGGFADGTARLGRPLFRRRAVQIDLGAGTWGAAQRGAARLDLGPTLGVTLPAQGGVVRLALDYRLRVAGSARPGSGAAVSLGSSF